MDRYPVSPYGHPMGKTVDGVWKRTAMPLATVAALSALADEDLTEGVERTLADGSEWRYDPNATAQDASKNLVVEPDVGDGAWVRTNDTVDLAFPVTKDTADGAVLFTVPAGFRLLVRRGYWENTTAWTGGTSSTIGLSSSNAAYSTKGDLLGGASGDAAANLGVGVKLGTAGAKITAGTILVPGDTVRFDKITDAFTAGAGKAHLVVDVLREG